MENKSLMACSDISKIHKETSNHLTIVSFNLGACASYKCLNNGICTNVNGAPKCLCIEGYKGDQCEEGIEFLSTYQTHFTNHIHGIIGKLNEFLFRIVTFSHNDCH